jgi:hypothetical protein
MSFDYLTVLVVFAMTTNCIAGVALGFPGKLQSGVCRETMADRKP